MSLTPEQLAQCQAEFEAKVSTWCLDLSKDNVGGYRSERTDDAYIVWKRCFEHRQKEIDALVEALEEIKQDLKAPLQL